MTNELGEQFMVEKFHYFPRIRALVVVRDENETKRYGNVVDIKFPEDNAPQIKTLEFNNRMTRPEFSCEFSLPTYFYPVSKKFIKIAIFASSKEGLRRVR